MTYKRSPYFDREGNPTDMWGWVAAFDVSFEDGTRQVADDYVDGWRVSTLWSGLDMFCAMDLWAEPQIFETMVFPPPASDADLRQWRYPTEAAALAGHARVLAELRAELAAGAAVLAELDAIQDTWKP